MGLDCEGSGKVGTGLEAERDPSGFIVVVVIEGADVDEVKLRSWRSEAMSSKVFWGGASRDGWERGTSSPFSLV